MDLRSRADIEQKSPTFLAHVRHTRSDISSCLATLMPLLSHISSNRIFLKPSFSFDLKKFSHEHLVSLKLPFSRLSSEAQTSIQAAVNRKKKLFFFIAQL